MNLSRPTLLVLLLALALSQPALAAKKKKGKKTKKAKVTETLPADLPDLPPDPESLPGNEPPPDAPAEPAADTREPAQLGPTAGMTEAPPADLIPPADEEPMPESVPPPEPPAKAAVAAPPPADAPLPDELPPPDAPITEAPPENIEAPPAVAAPPVRAAVPKLPATTPSDDLAPPESDSIAESEPPAEALPPGDEEAEAKKREEERKLAREKAVKALAAERALSDREERNRRAKAKRRLAEEDGSTLSATSRDYTWQSPRNFGLDLQYSGVQYKSLALDTGTTANKQGSGARLNVEWMFLQEVGKLSIGFGLLYSNIPQSATSTGEAITVNSFGLEAALAYRLDFIEHQILVPYARVGTDGVYAIQNRTNGSVFSQGSYRGTFWAAGAELCLFIFEKRTARLLDRNFGINETFLVFEYLSSKNANAGRQPDLSHEEFRFGLRFEI